MVVFYGAGATSSLGYPTTQKFVEQINNEDSIRSSYLFNLLIQQLPNYTDIEKILYLLDKLLLIPKATINPIRIFRFTTNTFVPIGPFQKNEIDLELCANILHLCFGVTLYPNSYKHVTDLFNDATTLYNNIRIQIINKYNRSKDSTAQNLHPDILSKIIEDVGNFDIFTTNYDLTLNSIFNNHERNNKFYVDDGFDNFYQLNPAYTPTTNKKLITYRQLHGSFHWWRVNKFTSNDADIIRNDSRPNNDTYTADIDNRIIIFPTLDLKSEIYDNSPFNTHIQKFNKKLELADVCLVIGFSFRDTLSSSFAAISQKNNLFVVDYVNKEINNTYEYYKNRLKNNPGIADYPMLAFGSDEIRDPRTVRILKNNLWLDGFPSTKPTDEFIHWVKNTVLA